jgi:hypothetical protein
LNAKPPAPEASRRSTAGPPVVAAEGATTTGEVLAVALATF